MAVKDIFPDKATERKILSLAIKCPSEGCDWTGELRDKQVIQYIKYTMYTDCKLFKGRYI